jgi:hypothetical protein
VIVVKRAIARMRQASRPTELPRALFSSLSPCLITLLYGFGSRSSGPPTSRLRSSGKRITASITRARTARRAPAYCTAESAEAGPNCGAPPGIARNRPDKCATGRTSSRAPKGPLSYRLAWRTGARRRIAITRRVGLRIQRTSKRGLSCRENDAGQHHKGQEKDRKS